jgi:hypothetical protein
MTCTNFSSSGSFRNSLVLVESSFRSTRKSFCDSMISTPCLSSWVWSVDRSMSRHLESACWNAFSEGSTRSSSSRGSIAARDVEAGRSCVNDDLIVDSWFVDTVVNAKAQEAVYHMAVRAFLGRSVNSTPDDSLHTSTDKRLFLWWPHSTFLRNNSSSTSGLSSQRHSSLDVSLVTTRRYTLLRYRP